jgi:hypothetical protein
MYKACGKLLFHEIRRHRRHRCRTLAEKPSRKESGLRKAILILAAAALVVSPSYIAYYLMRHGGLSVSIAAIVALVMFVVGAFLIVTLLKE